MTEISDLLDIMNRVEAKVDGYGEKISDMRVNVAELCLRTKTLEKGAEEMIQEKIKLNNKIRDAEKRRGDNRTKIAVAIIGAVSGISTIITAIKTLT